MTRPHLQRDAIGEEVGACGTVRGRIDVGKVAAVSLTGYAAPPGRMYWAMFRIGGVEVVAGRAKVGRTHAHLVDEEGVAARGQSPDVGRDQDPEAYCRNVTGPIGSPSGDSSAAAAVRPTMGAALLPRSDDQQGHAADHYGDFDRRGHQEDGQTRSPSHSGHLLGCAALIPAELRPAPPGARASCPSIRERYGKCRPAK